MRTDEGPLADAELEELRALLRRYLEHELDQWQLWRSETSHGAAYVSLSRKPLEGGSAEAYDAL